MQKIIINMIVNRKGLAFTSKTPGKTAEFNYFHAQGIISHYKLKHNFYLVDLPGVGYAQASRDLRTSWTDLLKNYVMNRNTLKVLFHLVDSRHGLLEADEECLSLLETLPNSITYIIIFLFNTVIYIFIIIINYI
jgi:GTP-binding protein